MYKCVCVCGGGAVKQVIVSSQMQTLDYTKQINFIHLLDLSSLSPEIRTHKLLSHSSQILSHQRLQLPAGTVLMVTLPSQPLSMQLLFGDRTGISSDISSPTCHPARNQSVKL